jgi:hypothetical protein
MTLTGIQVYNANGQQASDFTISSGSAAVYGADGIESTPSADAPEPATFLLAGVLPAALAGARRRQSLPNRACNKRGAITPTCAT